MIPKGLFSQIALILLSVLVIFTYVKPALLVTKSIEDKITLYQEQQQKVTNVNKKLAHLKDSVANVASADKLHLLTYMPNTIDTIAVPRDISFITDEAGVIIKDIKYVGAHKAAIGVVADPSLQDAPDAHIFSLVVDGSYSQIKQTLAYFEENEYPLEVHDLVIAKQEGGFLEATMTVYTYNRALPESGTSSQ